MKKDGKTKKMIGRSALAAVTLSALLVASVPVFAAEENSEVKGVTIVQQVDEASDDKDNGDKEITIDLDDLKPDYGDLTEDEIKELETLNKRAEELEKKAGLWFDTEELDDFCKDVIDSEDLDLSDITLDGIKLDDIELEGIELDGIELDGETATTLLKDVLSISDEEMEELKGLYDEANNIGLVALIEKDDLSDEEAETFMKNHEAELKELEKHADKVFTDVFGDLDEE